ncbi:hypothetical protein KIW84_021450 [Lathyrus oleraceus]|uniref:Uncharacterized protein n=1 Tax=Pisum sativum TaxID=3888 RepID=A0A9D5B9Y5_PEA|nr:hypothetical protein KIW84_021450 [Pisum sativum]
MCLLEDRVKGAVEELLSNEAGWFKLWFSEVKKWMGKLFCTDDVTKSGSKMDVARLLVRTNCANSINEVIFVNINGVRFRLKLVEDSYGPVSFPLFPASLKVDDDLNEAAVEREEIGGDDDVDEPFCEEVPLISVGHAWLEQGVVIGPMDNFIRKVLVGLSQKSLPAIPFCSENVADDTYMLARDPTTFIADVIGSKVQGEYEKVPGCSNYPEGVSACDENKELPVVYHENW